MNKKETLIYLNYVRVPNRIILKMSEKFDFEKFFAIERKNFKFLDKRIYDRIFNGNNLENFKFYLDEIYSKNIKYVTIFDKEYPENLQNIPDKPVILFYKGNLNKSDAISVSFVGARKCTDYGKWACKNLVGEISQVGFTTVSGLAYGIDSICHKTSLDLGKRTVGVIGSGIDIVYPKANLRLYQEMEDNGLILSEFPLKTPPASYNFPRRNRIISGFSLATVVVEAKEKSGTMITTSCALEQGREVFCVPGNINSIYSRGCNKLIQEGSKIVTCAKDIIDELAYISLFDYQTQKKDLGKLSEEELKIYKYIEDNPSTNSDKIAENLHFIIETVNYLLSLLEINDYIETIGNNEFVIKG